MPVSDTTAEVSAIHVSPNFILYAYKCERKESRWAQPESQALAAQMHTHLRRTRPLAAALAPQIRARFFISKKMCGCVCGLRLSP